MYEDEPSDKVHDVLAEAIFGDHPLGRPIIGRAEVIASVPVPDIARYHDARYELGQRGRRRGRQRRPRPGGGDGGGAVRHGLGSERIRGPAASFRIDQRSGAGHTPGDDAPRARFHAKETEQYHLCLGGHGIRRADERRFALRVLDTILGGSTSSRLFQEVREKRGLAYAVYSYSSQYVDSGEVALYVGHAARQRRRGGGGHRERAAAAARRPRHGRGARPREGERQGSHGALDGVDARADEPPRQLAPDRRTAAHARRDDRADRRRHARRRDRARPRALRAGAPVGGRRRLRARTSSARRSARSTRRWPRRERLLAAPSP